MLKMNEFTEIHVDIMSERTATASATVNIDFEEAFALHHRTVFRAARSIVSDSGLAEDVTQETFLRLHNNLDSITSDEMLKPWLIRVAINVARNTIRGQMRANTRDDVRMSFMCARFMSADWPMMPAVCVSDGPVISGVRTSTESSLNSASSRSSGSSTR